MKYRKKPVVIEAFQMTRARRVDNSEWPNWLHEAWNKEAGEQGRVYNQYLNSPDGPLMVVTHEGPVNIGWGDFIVCGVQGELYPCKPDIFEATHEVEADDLAAAARAKVEHIADNRERLISAWVAETGLLPSESVLVVTDTADGQRTHIERRPVTVTYCFAIYNRPRDYPTHIVVRRWKIEGGGPPEPEKKPLFVGVHIEDARRNIRLAAGHDIVMIDNDDPDPAIVEVWM